MAEVSYIIHYLKSLRKGYDKDEFDNMVTQLEQEVNESGLNNEDFHNLVTIWLNLSIPVTKWTKIGTSLAPLNIIEARTVKYILRWLMACHIQSTTNSRIGFVLDWLTAAMDCNAIDTIDLNMGYEIFLTFFNYEKLSTYSLKLIYKLTKPLDVTRWRVNNLIALTTNSVSVKKQREAQVLLGLFKSYKCGVVPENVPAIPVHSVFRKINQKLLNRFNRIQVHRNGVIEERPTLPWTNTINVLTSRKKRKCVLLVPEMKFVNFGSEHYSKRELMKNYLDFNEPVALLEYSLRHQMERPANLLSMLFNDTSIMLLAIASDTTREFLTHHLQHLLEDCFLNNTEHSYAEKADLLKRLNHFQRVLQQGVPVVTEFLAKFMPFWNERDYLSEILYLVEWLSVESTNDVYTILKCLGSMFHRNEKLKRCTILTCLVHLHANLAFASTKDKHLFMETSLSENYSQVLTVIASFISELCEDGLQANPGDSVLLLTSVWSFQTMIHTALRHNFMLTTTPKPITVMLLLTSPSAITLEKLADILLLYRELFIKHENSSIDTEIPCTFIIRYMADVVNSLWTEQMLTARDDGIVFKKLRKSVVAKIMDNVVDSDKIFGLSSHLAFSPYHILIDDNIKAYKKFWYNAIESDYGRLAKLLSIVFNDMETD